MMVTMADKPRPNAVAEFLSFMAVITRFSALR